MGIEDYDIIRVQGTDLLGADREQILQKAYVEAEKISSTLAKK